MLCEVVGEHLARYGHRSADIFELFSGLDYRPFGLRDGRLLPVTLAEAGGYNDLFFAPRESAFGTGA